MTNFEKYIILREELINRLDNGTITTEMAEMVDRCAFEKYIAPIEQDSCIHTEAGLNPIVVGAGIAGASLGKLHANKLMYNSISKYLQKNDKDFIPLSKMKCKSFKNYNVNDDNTITGDELKHNKILYKAYKSHYHEVYSYDNKNMLVADYVRDKKSSNIGNKRCDINILNKKLDKYKTYYMYGVFLKQGFVNKELENWIAKVLFGTIKNKKLQPDEMYEQVISQCK